jgi:uncharacterized tellurite resistance protein B-like protein
MEAKTTITAELKGHFLRLYQMAMTDGDFSPSEWKMLYLFAEERGVPRDELDKILLETTGKIEIPHSIGERVEYLYDLSRMIWADGKVTEDELATLKKYCRKFEFEEENISGLADYLIESVRDGKTKEEILSELN